MQTTVLPGTDFSDALPPGSTYTVSVPSGASLYAFRTGPTGATVSSVANSGTTVFGPYFHQCRFVFSAKFLPSTVSEAIADVDFSNIGSGGGGGSGPANTDALAEGSSNLYYTNARAAAAAPVQSVAGKTGIVTLTASDVGVVKNVANGFAGLDGSGLVPASILPSYVDDVLEFANLGAFPATGETGKIYVSLATALIYRWSGSTYIPVDPSPGSTDSIAEGSTNLYFTSARALAAAPAENAGSIASLFSDVGNVVGTQTADKLRFDLNWNGEFGNPSAISTTNDGAVLLRHSYTPDQTALKSRLAALEEGGGGGGGGGGSSGPLASDYYIKATIGDGTGSTVGSLAASFTDIQINAIESATGGMTLDPTTGRVTIVLSGRYSLSGNLRLADASTSCNIGIGIHVLGVTDQPSFYWHIHPNADGSARDTIIFPPTQLHLFKGEQVRLFVYCDAGGGSRNFSSAMLQVAAASLDDIVANAAHRYWRINTTKNSGNTNFIGLRSVEFHETVGGAQYATNSNCTVTASAEEPGYEATHVLNTSGTAWVGSAVTTSTLNFDFGTAKLFAEVKLVPEDGRNDAAPGVFTLEVSDNATDWVVVGGRTAGNWVSGGASIAQTLSL